MKLTIIGASGHGKVIAEAALLGGYDEIEFLDDNPALSECAGFPVSGPSSDCREKDNDIFIGIGNAKIRRRLSEEYASKSMPVLVHPRAVVSQTAAVGRGSVVMAGAVINPGVRIGRGCIINTSSSVDHDCILEDYVHVSVGARLCGSVTVGEETWIGAGCTVINNVSICSGCIIGAGAVVTNDITEPGTYVGIPARLLSKQPGSKKTKS